MLAACASHPQVPNCSVAGHIGDGWSSSFTAGCFDRNGVFAGGSQVMHLLAHKGRLYAANGYFRRIDGEQPRYELVLDMSGQVDSRTSRARFQSIGGIRGLSAIEGSVPGRKSLIFVWHNGSQSQACIHRLDPKPDGSWSDRQEVCLAQLASRHIGAPVSFVLGAYSNFLPLSDPSTGELLHVVGIEAFIPGRGFDPLTAHNQRYSTGGHYAGALYALRDSKGGWRIGEVGGKFRPGKRELVSVYTYAMSPFGGTDEGRIYLGGYDPNHFASTNTAWVASAPLAELLKTH